MNNSYYPPTNFESTYPPINGNTLNTNNNSTQEMKYPYMTSLLQSKIGANAKIYMSFPDSIEWRDKIFEGKISTIGNDYILIIEKNNVEQVLPNIYVNYIEF